MNKLKAIALVLGMTFVFGGSLLTIVVPNPAAAVTITSSSTPADCSQNFLTFPTWFNGLVKVTKDSAGVYECTIDTPKSGDLSPFIWHIVLNVIDIGLQLVGYVAGFFVLYAGFHFLTSNGEPDEIAKARTTILNAVVGLIISVAAVAIVNLISGILIYNP